MFEELGSAGGIRQRVAGVRSPSANVAGLGDDRCSLLRSLRSRTHPPTKRLYYRSVERVGRRRHARDPAAVPDRRLPIGNVCSSEKDTISPLRPSVSTFGFDRTASRCSQASFRARRRLRLPPEVAGRILEVVSGATSTAVPPFLRWVHRPSSCSAHDWYVRRQSRQDRRPYPGFGGQPRRCRLQPTSRRYEHCAHPGRC